MAKDKDKKSKKSARVRAESGGQSFDSLNDPAVLEFIRTGQTQSGVNSNGRKALANMALYRCVTLIAQSVAMLPLNLIHDDEGKQAATDNPLYRLLKKQPNAYQTAYEFRLLMQGWVLQYGNAYARIVRGVGGKVLALHPIHPMQVQAEQNPDFSLRYRITRKDGALLDLDGSQMLHIRDFSDDGIVGISRVKLAKKALGIAFDAETAAESLFQNGVLAGGALSAPSALSDKAYERLKHSLHERHKGADKAGDFMILEEGLKAEKWANTASDAQHIEQRNHQIEEIARLFAVPRPLLMMDDTSWGSGISELGLFFHKYGLLPWLTAWEQALNRSLLNAKEQDRYVFKFNAGALLRGSLKEQAEFFAKALGSGGHGGWLTQNEVREISDSPRIADPEADKLRPPQQGKDRTNKEKDDEPD
ncbi:phage portal protein [Conchiformibius steedae]|uniref:Phage portal protein n=1 Tax=Conchiformibius steedae TaxID=153493 RepID=A0A3P2A821_9NEIS|nr:phage portal protein [Conchiformibius steedae]RRD90420.1 phage portal protein [Conchiformibius steedae]